MIVAPVLEYKTDPVEPTANRGAHLYIVFSDTADKDDEVHSTEHSNHRGYLLADGIAEHVDSQSGSGTG
jgi:hypothetical protein